MTLVEDERRRTRANPGERRRRNVPQKALDDVGLPVVSSGSSNQNVEGDFREPEWLCPESFVAENQVSNEKQKQDE